VCTVQPFTHPIILSIPASWLEIGLPFSSDKVMEHRTRLSLPILYVLLASMAASIFFVVLVLLDRLQVSVHYYHATIIQAAFMSQQKDLYVLWFSTLLAFLALAILMIIHRQLDLREWVPISTLAAGLALLICGLIHLAAIVILTSHALTLTAKTIYKAGFHSSLSKKRILTLIVVHLLSLVLLIEWPALIYWIVTGFSPSNEIGRRAAVLELKLSYAASSISPWLYAAFLFSWLWAPALRFLKSKIAGKHRSVESSILRIGAGKTWTALLAILLLFGLSVLVGYYPYWHGPTWLVGTDVYWRYKDPLDGLAGMSGLAGFEQALKEHQSGFLILLLGSMKMTGFSSQTILRYTPMVLTALTAIATFALASAFGLGRYESLMAGIASIMWIPTTIGIFTSILANWLALAIWVVSLWVLVKDPKIDMVGVAIIGSLFSLSILFIHPWSWGPFAAVINLYLLSRLHGRKFSRRQLLFCTVFDLLGLMVVSMSLLTLQTSQGLRVASALSLYSVSLADPKTILAFPNAIEYFATMWSPFLTPISMVVAIVGILAAVHSHGRLSHFLLSWLCVTSIASVLATSLGFSDGGYLWRVFFVAPIAVPTGLGASCICKTLERKLGEDDHVSLTLKQWYGVAGVTVSTLSSSLMYVTISDAFPEFGQLLALLLNLLLVTMLFHLARGRLGTSDILRIVIAVLVAGSGVRSLEPLLRDPHNISMG